MNIIKAKDHSGKRFASGFIDYLIICAFFFVYVLTFGEPNETGVERFPVCQL